MRNVVLSSGRAAHRLGVCIYLVITCVTLCALFSAVAAVEREVEEDFGELVHVHLIPHSHCDPGWLSTFEEYYLRDVSVILTNVVYELQNDPAKRFIWSESSFFQRWYESLSEARKLIVKRFVTNGQLEFVGGGWSQHDEATPDIASVLNQMTEGHQYLFDTFGVRPRFGWQIDPFGHSSLTPSLFALMGFDALVINRIHYSIKREFKELGHMEFMWRGVNVGPSNATALTDMLTHVLHTHYTAPDGFDWEEGSTPVNMNNVERMAEMFAREMLRRRNAYRTNHLLVAWGDDFKFKNAAAQFSNMDRILAEIQKHPTRYGITLRYSTLSDYFDAMHSSNPPTFPIYSGDFFPYADNADSYWTGFYSTRPYLKAVSRRVNALIRSADSLYALAQASSSLLDTLEPFSTSLSYWEGVVLKLQGARRQAGLFLHHDAITGTSRNAVVGDYMVRMRDASNSLRDVIRASLEVLLTRTRKPRLLIHPFTMTVNPDTVYPVVLYNSLAWTRRELVTQHVTTPFVTVKDSEGSIVHAQIDEEWHSAVGNMVDSPRYVLYWVANIPALGAATYFVSVLSRQDHTSPPSTTHSRSDVYVLPEELHRIQARRGHEEDSHTGDGSMHTVEHHALHSDTVLELKSDVLSVRLDPTDGLVRSLTNTTGAKNTKVPIHIDLKQSFYEYRTFRSGAYLFRPQGRAKVLREARIRGVRLIRGPIVSMFITEYGEFEVRGTMTRSVGFMDSYLKLESSVVVNANQELVMRMDTSMSNQRTFFTHNSGEWVRRVTQEYPIASNYYPMNWGARIHDVPSSARLTFFSSQTMGCGGMDPGELEFMLHRSLNQDDGRGLSQAVMDGTRVSIPLWLRLDLGSPKLSMTRRQRYMFSHQALHFNNPLEVLYGKPDTRSTRSPQAWNEQHNSLVSPLGSKSEFPPHIHLLSMSVANVSRHESSYGSMNFAAQLHVRFQSLEGRKKGNWSTNIRTLFVYSYLHVFSSKETTLTFTKHRQFPPSRLSFKGEFAHLLPSKNTSSNVDDSVTPASRQNSKEEGVFVSKAALTNRDNEVDSTANEQPISSSTVIGDGTRFVQVGMMQIPSSTHRRQILALEAKNSPRKPSSTNKQPRHVIDTPLSRALRVDHIPEDVFRKDRSSVPTRVEKVEQIQRDAAKKTLYMFNHQECPGEDTRRELPLRIGPKEIRSFSLQVFSALSVQFDAVDRNPGNPHYAASEIEGTNPTPGSKWRISPSPSSPHPSSRTSTPSSSSYAIPGTASLETSKEEFEQIQVAPRKKEIHFMMEDDEKAPGHETLIHGGHPLSSSSALSSFSSAHSLEMLLIFLCCLGAVLFYSSRLKLFQRNFKTDKSYSMKATV